MDAAAWKACKIRHRVAATDQAWGRDVGTPGPGNSRVLGSFGKADSLVEAA